MRQNLQNYFCFSILLLSILSFFTGFFFREDLAGGGLLDLGHEWHNHKLLKENIFGFLFGNYEASRFPFFHLINIYLNKFITNQNDLINSFFLYSFVVPVIFYLALKTLIKEKNNYFFLLLVSILFLSPYFRTSSFWGLQENLSYIFLLLTIFINEKYPEKKYLILSISFLSFYSDQKFLFLPAIFFLKEFFDQDNKININKKNIKILLYCIVLSLPAIVIFYFWGGLTPKVTTSGINKEGFNPQNIIYVTNIMALYFFPFLILKSKNNFLTSGVNLKVLFFVIAGIFVVYLAYRLFLKTDLIYGGGWAYKIYQLLLTINIVFAEIFFAITFVVTSLILLAYIKTIQINLTNMFIIFYLYLQNILVGVTFQEYFDPLILFLIIFFFEKKKFSKYSFSNSLFIFIYFLIFTIGVFSYRYFIL